ncbi:MAG: hypothetical protein QW046_04010 [Candidatus Micrarchaeaceae archaeon]
MLSPELQEVFVWLLTNAKKNMTKEYAEKYDFFQKNLPKESSHLLDEIKPPQPSFLEEIDRVEWLPGNGWKIYIKGKCYDAGAGFANTPMSFESWYSMNFNRYPDYGGMKWREVVSFIMEKAEETPIMDARQESEKNLIDRIIEVIENYNHLDRKSPKKEIVDPERTVFFDDDYYYVWNAVIKRIMKDEGITLEKASRILSSFIDKDTERIRGQRYWKFRRRIIDKKIELDMQEGQDKL